MKTQFEINWWVDFRDPWVDIFYNKNLYRSLNAIQKDAALEKKVIQKADGVLTTVGGILHETLKAKAPNQRFHSIPNGYDAQLMEKVQSEKPKDIFHVVYTGLLTTNQAYDNVLNVLDGLDSQIPVRISLAGNIDPEIIQGIRLKHSKLELIFFGYVSHLEAVQLMKSAHLLLNFIFEGAQMQMISGKILEYMATGVPVLSIGDSNSEAGKFINQGTAAKMLNTHDLEGITDFIQQVASQKGRLQNEFPDLENWSREGLTKRLVEEVF